MDFWGTCHDPNLWRFVDWTSTDNRGGDEAWRQFIADLGKSKLPIHQADSLAFAYQSTQDEGERNRILHAYCALLESHFNEVVTTTEGQKVFSSFKNYSCREDRHNLNIVFEARWVELMAHVFQSGNWMESDTILTAALWTSVWKSVANQGRPLPPEPSAVKLLNALEGYVAWAKKDARWKNEYQNPRRYPFDQALTSIPGNIIMSYQDLAKLRLKLRSPILGAVPIQAWNPKVFGLPNSEKWMFGEVMITSGNSLFVAKGGEGIAEVDVKTMSILRMIKFPLVGHNFVSCLACNENSIMITIKDRMFRCSRSSNGSAWEELKPPGENGGADLTWTLRGFKEDFSVGSRNSNFETASPRMLAGLVRDSGDVKWLAASNRRPAVNAIDKLDPKGALIAYRNKIGNTMVLLGNALGRVTLVELETGRETAGLGCMGVDQMRGDMPIYWVPEYDMVRGIRYLVVFDPESDQPRLIFKSIKGAKELPAMWNDVKPLYDVSRPEFQGQFIAPIVHDGVLWLLKREVEKPAEFVKNDPEAFSLVRVGLDDDKVVTIPLTYQVSASIRQMEQKLKREQRSLDRPIINERSLTATPSALFFASSGFGYGKFTWKGDRLWTGDLVPMLLYITWDDINAWIAKNAPNL